MQLVRALRIRSDTCLALAGAGGKTSSLFHLARQILAGEQPPPTVLVTTSTRLGTNQADLADYCLEVSSTALPAHFPEGVVLVTAGEQSQGKLSGLGEADLASLYEQAKVAGLPLLVEADGARLKPLKAPAAHEPAIPKFVDSVVVCAGLSGLNKPLGEKWVHRSQQFAELTGAAPGERISVEALARLLLHPQGGLKNIPGHARRAVLLNQADAPRLQAQGQALARRLTPGFHAAVVSSMQKPESNSGMGTGEALAVYQPVAGVVLAAGEAARFGSPKQLLPWRGEPLVRRAAQQALQAGLKPVMVVTGAAAEEVQQALEGLDIMLIYNPHWQEGQGDSVRAGVAALPPETGAAIFLLADQPRVEAPLMLALFEAYAHSLSPITAPLVDGRRGNPVLFDSELFGELSTMKGDSGGRELFSRYPVAWLPWHDPAPLLDIDTPEDYQRLLENG